MLHIETSRYTIPPIPVEKNRIIICEHCLGNHVEEENHFLLDYQRNASTRVNLYIAIGNISKRFTKLDNSDKFINRLYVGAYIAEHVAFF